jgi:hypothetical protein
VKNIATDQLRRLDMRLEQSALLCRAEQVRGKAQSASFVERDLKAIMLVVLCKVSGFFDCVDIDGRQTANRARG